MPSMDAARLALGRELDGVVAWHGLAETLLKFRYDLVQEMLASDPLSVFEIVPLSTGWAMDHFCVRVRDDLDIRLARAANDLELAHRLSRVGETGGLT